MNNLYNKKPEETLKEEVIDLQDMINFIEDMKKTIDRYVEYDTMSVAGALTALDGELELYNMEVANG